MWFRDLFGLPCLQLTQRGDVTWRHDILHVIRFMGKNDELTSSPGHLTGRVDGHGLEGNVVAQADVFRSMAGTRSPLV